MRVNHPKLFVNETMTTDGYSPAVDLQMISGYSCQASWIGNAQAYIFIQVSNDDVNPTNWCLIDASIVDTQATSGTHIWKQYMAPFRWFRLGYSVASGSSTLDAIINFKGLGN